MVTSLINKWRKKMINQNNVVTIPTLKKDRNDDEQVLFENKFKEVVEKAKEFTQQIHLNRINLLKLMLEAKEFGFNNDDMSNVFEELGYSRATKCKIRAVINNEVLMNRLDKLPSSYATLYQLRIVEEQDIDDFINNNEITILSSHSSVVNLLKEKGLIETEKDNTDYTGNCPIKINYDKAKATPEALRIINAMEVTLANYVSQLEEHDYAVRSTTINLEELMRSAA